jgi:hypothetical protein
MEIVRLTKHDTFTAVGADIFKIVSEIQTINGVSELNQSSNTILMCEETIRQEVGSMFESSEVSTTSRP